MFTGCCGSAHWTRRPIFSPLSSTCMALQLCPCWFCSATQTPASLALYTIIHAGDELEGNPFKYGEQYPREKKKKSFSPGQVKGEGGVTPRLLWKPRVTRKTQFSDVIRRRNVLGWGLIYLCGAEGLNSCVQLGLFRVDFMAPKSVPVL